jgi:hypothetical protein
MKFILRQTIHEFTWERQLSEIIALCKASGIDEVMLMEQSHQIVMVPYPLEKHRRMTTIYQHIAKVLKKEGIDYSVNIATIIGHSDAPVPADQQLPFTRFVGENLKPCDAVYCMSDPAWIEYACQVVELYASTHPKRIMIDDDFRSLNHTAQYGCFCSTHAQKVSEKTGMDLDTKSLANALLGLDPQENKIKQAWQSINFKMQVEAAQAIEERIHRIDRNIQVGLMNSGEPAHSLQGRDMSVLLKAFAGEEIQALSRPAGGVYADGLHTQIVNMHQMPALSYAAVKIPTTWVSEIENWPHSRYIKSVSITRLQMMMHALWGADALTLNLYDYLATPLSLEADWAKLIKDIQPTLDLISSHRQGKILQGVSLPWKADSASTIHNRNHRYEDLLPSRTLDTLLPLLGIPVQFTEGKVQVLLGDDVLNYDHESLMRFLSNGLFIDNLAAEHLIQRGYGEYLGIQLEGNIITPCVERLTHIDFSQQYFLSDLPSNWFRMSIQGDNISKMSLHTKAIALSHFMDDHNQVIAPAMSLFTNNLNGKVCVMAQRVQDLSWLHRARSIQLQAIFKALDPMFKDSWMIHDHPNLAPFVYSNPDDHHYLMAIVNTGLDLEDIEMPHPKCRVLLGSESKGRLTLKPLEMVLVTWEEK